MAYPSFLLLRSGLHKPTAVSYVNKFHAALLVCSDQIRWQLGLIPTYDLPQALALQIRLHASGPVSRVVILQVQNIAVHTAQV